MPQKTRSKPLSPIQKCPQRKALGTAELPRGAFPLPQMQLEPPCLPFLSNPKHIPLRNHRGIKNSASENAFKARCAHPKVPPKEGLGTTELPRGAFTQPHMQLDLLCSLFLSNPKDCPTRHWRGIQKRASENAFKAPFAHPKVPPKEGFGYNLTPKGSLHPASLATGPSVFALSKQP